jgi:hypothetical protein
MLMMEILINERDWASKTGRLGQIIESLKDTGWERFGHCGTIILFKDVTQDKADEELKKLRISEVSAEAWEEDMYSYRVF